VGLVKKWQVEKSNTLELDNNIVEIKDNSVGSIKLDFGTWEKIAEIEVSTATAAIDITGLDINTDKLYKLIIIGVSEADTTCFVQAFINGNTTSSDYNYERILARDTSISANRDNYAEIALYWEWTNFFTVGLITRTPDGYYVYWGEETLVETTGSATGMSFYVISKFTVENITQLNLRASQSKGFGVGTKIYLFRVSK